MSCVSAIDYRSLSKTLLQVFCKIYNCLELKVFYEKEPFSDHVTVLPLDWLRQKCYCNGCLQKKLSDCDVISRKNKTKSLEIQRAIPTISYRDLEANKDEWTFKYA